MFGKVDLILAMSNSVLMLFSSFLGAQKTFQNNQQTIQTTTNELESDHKLVLREVRTLALVNSVMLVFLRKIRK